MCIYTQYYTVEKPSDRRTNRRTSVWVALVHSPSQRRGILESKMYMYMQTASYLTSASNAEVNVVQKPMLADLYRFQMSCVNIHSPLLLSLRFFKIFKNCQKFRILHFLCRLEAYVARKLAVVDWGVAKAWQVSLY